MIHSGHLPVVGSALLFWLFGIIVYDILFHPLAKYPGPLLAKLTKWYEFSVVKTGQHHIWLYKLHEKYGPVVRVGPNRLSYRTVEALHSIYGDNKANVKKAGFAEVIANLKSDIRNLLTINNLRQYKPRRRLISHAFSEQALRSSEKYILKSIRRWCEVLGSKIENSGSWSSSIDISGWASVLTEEVLGELCFGGSFGVIEKGYSEMGKLATDGAAQAQIISWLPIGNWFLTLLRHIADYGRTHQWESMRAQVEFDNIIDTMIKKCLSAGINPTRKDFLHYILQAKDPETGTMISPDEIIVEAGVLYGAGVDTSASLFSSCLFYLTHTPTALATLTSTLRTAFSTVEDITSNSSLASIHYLRACLDESLRFTPPVPGPLLRVVTAGGLHIGTDFLPPGTEVSVSAYAIHHNETYFPDSFTFNPDRWLNDTNAATRAAFCPFSLGQRVCIGRHLAYLDVSLALARFLWLFDVRVEPGCEEVGARVVNDVHRRVGDVRKEYDVMDWMVCGRKGPRVQIKKREDERG